MVLPGRYNVVCGQHPEHAYQQEVLEGANQAEICGVCGGSARFSLYSATPAELAFSQAVKAPSITELVDDLDDDPDPRDGKPWPPSEDCSHCPGHRDGPHKMSCHSPTNPLRK